MRYVLLTCCLFLWGCAPIETSIWLEHPESVVGYEDRLFVSNLGWDLMPDRRDGDGFISSLDMEGSIQQKHFITDLNAPKGIQVIQEKIYVCDLDVIKVFGIHTGEFIMEFSFKDLGVINLNDITEVYKDGVSVFVTATRIGKIFRLNIDTGEITELLPEGVEFLQTNGLVLDNQKGVLYMVEYGNSHALGGRIIRINIEENSAVILGGNMQGRLYDGVVLQGDTLYISDWTHTLFSLDLNSRTHLPEAREFGLQGPADMWLDQENNRIVIPRMMAGDIVFYDL